MSRESIGGVPDWVTLTDDETVVWRGGPSTARVVQELLGETLLVVVGIAVVAVGSGAVAAVDPPTLSAVPLGLVGVGLAVVLLGVVLGVVTYLRFRAIVYLITTSELYRKRGLFSRSVRNLRLERVQDSGFRQSAVQRLLGYGTVHVSTAGGGGVELRFRHVTDPEAVNGRIARQLDRVRGE
ncbi:hypothetical protein BRD14_05360 [Halobacteriales archaeon SW_5_68_122]|nr:MAG: hypothetical protein BRD14_05360 [Halobacteriales archaeon SW_5_68_122]